MVDSADNVFIDEDWGQWPASSGTMYQFELDWQTEPTIAVRLFINGALFGSSIGPTSVTRGSSYSLNLGYVSSSHYASVGNLQMYSKVNHTAPYTAVIYQLPLTTCPYLDATNLHVYNASGNATLIDGDLNVGGALYLPNVGSTPSPLDYYEEYYNVLNFTDLDAVGNAWYGQTGAPTSVAYSVVRIGKAVILRLGQTIAATTNISSYVMAGSFPSRFLPTSPTPTNCSVIIYDTGRVAGCIDLSSQSNTITIYRVPVANFSTNSIGWYDISCAYFI
jgi:hypothetical protein